MCVRDISLRPFILIRKYSILKLARARALVTVHDSLHRKLETWRCGYLKVKDPKSRGL